ncbi:MlaD family protein [Geothrix campi]|jgi:phospholipid/cholesterol/gamma-HCH transport system substrate-binding protein|uniref:MlaD family protein n=1 Tax=Geothrix campi TaxID=2966450 RepID=UPI0021472F31|nr:MlaD family protein [Geothrix sp. SG10]
MKPETKVGLFFTGAILLLAVLVFRSEKLEIGGKKNQSEKFTYFDSVAGLNVQSAVRIAGVKVGDVRTITLENGKARVVVGLSQEVPVYADAFVSLGSIGILGEKFIDLDAGHSAKGPFPEGQPLPSKAGVSLDNLMETLADIGKNVKGVTQALNESIGGEQGRQKLDEIVDNIRVLTAEFRSMAQENHSAINNTMGNVEAITADLRDKLPKLAQQFESVGKNLNAMLEENRPELKGVVSDVRKLAQSFQGTADNLKVLTTRINNGEGTIGKLLNDETTIKKINEAVDNVNNMLGGFNKMDFRLDMDAAQWDKRKDSRVGLGLEIAPRPDYWYALGFASTPDGKLSESTRTVTQLDPVTGQPITVLEKNQFVTTDRSFTASAQFAKRIGAAVFSAGIVEGKGGGGVELRTLENDRLRLGLLAYDFTKRADKPNPRYRFTSSYQFWKGAYVQAGVQDIGNKDLRTIFFGGGLRWKDDDLKKIIGLAGASK